MGPRHKAGDDEHHLDGFVSDQARSLLSAAAVRERAHEVLAVALADGLAEWRVDLDRLALAAELTASATQAAYPDLDVPFHARWRHFEVDGRDLWAEGHPVGIWDPPERARIEFDLAMVSVLLDAGAGVCGGLCHRRRRQGMQQPRYRSETWHACIRAGARLGRHSVAERQR